MNSYLSIFLLKVTVDCQKSIEIHVHNISIDYDSRFHKKKLTSYV